MEPLIPISPDLLAGTLQCFYERENREGGKEGGIQRDGKRNRERAPEKAKDKVTTTTIYMKEDAAYTRMVGNEINKPLAQIPIVGEMYRAVTFPFLR